MTKREFDRLTKENWGAGFDPEQGDSRDAFRMASDERAAYRLRRGHDDAPCRDPLSRAWPPKNPSRTLAFRLQRLEKV